jgi:hypothetical protein
MPLASGTRARMPTCLFRACSKNSAAGRRRKQLKTICTVCMPGNSMALRASSTRSTLTP